MVDEATGEVRWTVQAHAGGETKVAMSNDGRFVGSVSTAEENWRIWDVASGAEWMAGARHDGTGACICENKLDGSFRVVQEGCPVVAHPAGLCALIFSPYGLATGDLDGDLILWDAQTGEAQHL